MIRSKVNKRLKKAVLFLSLIISVDGYSQKWLPFSIDSDEFSSYEKASTLFKKGNYKESIFYYNKAKDILNLFPNEQYKFAIALWVNGDSTQSRRVFYNALKRGLLFYNQEYFNASPFIREMSINENVYQFAIKTTFTDSNCLFEKQRQDLLKLREKDQLPRTKIVYDSLEFSMNDSVNRHEFKGIINEIGWPGIIEVGVSGEGAAFLIAQHSDNDLLFLKKCLDLMTVEFHKGNVSVSSYAMLIDRYLINSKRKQIFGTQVYFDAKLNSYLAKECMYPNKINVLRNLFFHVPLEEYLSVMNNRNRE